MQSLDWSNELVKSLWWLLKAFAITAVCFALVSVLLIRLTRWGRQFWRIGGGYFSGKGAWKTYLFIAVLLIFALWSVRMNVLLSYQGNDMYTALQGAAQALGSGDTASLDAAKTAFWHSLIVFAVLATIHVVRSMLDLYAGQAFDIRWRLWQTDRLVDDWLDGRAFYRGRFIDDTIDNPDQRIEQDVTDYVQTTRTLAIGAVSAIASVISFTKILWDLSGPLTVLGVEIPRAMMFLVFAYVLISTVIAFWIGRPLIKLNFLNESLTATFRYALVRLRDSAENVAFYRGERVEGVGLLSRFRAVIKNYWQIVYRLLKFNGWNLSVNQTAVVFPLIIQAPRFFSGAVTLGDVTQTGSAFGQVHDSLSFFRESYDTFAGYRATLIRLDGLMAADGQSRELPKLASADTADALEIVGVGVRRPDGEVLIDDLSLRMTPGDALVVKGKSGSGKTTLLRSLAELWPYADGELRRPPGHDTLFLSQMPYLPLGDLRTAISYPAAPGELDDEALRETLRKVFLSNLTDRLTEVADWAKILSPGEQQRIAFARILLIKPKVVFLDEATSAIDEGLEFAIYQLIRSEVPECILVSVAHRSTVDQHHTQKLELEGDGTWELSPVS
ncbi:ABC transporter ATP-binding protein/permease [Antrihabitans cavernicola]|uniref:ABC transporter ATP-binding protein/permease n=1 Tax=Antrihabitans cavernicola TaxID=2495913 RepID=A0A5A7S4F3_9NOCA|nr:ABC transporter ATP-binding protein/permease [Spelaeibacter cavernicola]KAA0021058.1 ABC transporter ATP-binding protein/permease [Spelaeibacter cavernicola]